MSAYKLAIDALSESGAVVAVQYLNCEVKKEQKRQREIAKEDPAVAVALSEVKAARIASERRQAIAVQDANRREKELEQIRRESQQATEMLREKRKEPMCVEQMLETKYALKRYAPEDLGQGKARSGGPAARKLRFEVLERMARLGTGLSAAQKNDWRWFRDAWDTKMCAEHGGNWGGIFSGWMQKVVEDLAQGAVTGFSTFAHDETRRNFSEVPMLLVPALEDAAVAAPTAAQS